MSNGLFERDVALPQVRILARPRVRAARLKPSAAPLGSSLQILWLDPRGRPRRACRHVAAPNNDPMAHQTMGWAL